MKRYDTKNYSGLTQVVRDDSGPWVRAEEAEAIEAERDALRAEVAEVVTELRDVATDRDTALRRLARVRDALRLADAAIAEEGGEP